MRSKFFSSIYILFTVAVLAVLASCGGGGGGGGAVSFAPDSNMPHNGGDAGGWGTGAETGGGFGGTTIEEENATLLIGQVPALDVTNVNIVLYVNGTRYEINNVNETTTTEVLPKISIGDTVSGTAYIYVAGEAQPREALLDPQAIGFHNTLKFKVPYKYECIDRGTSVKTGTYYSRDGIDLADITGVRVAGWLCSDGTMHYGSYITGVRGDITLTAVYKVAVTSDVPEISRPSSLISTLGISSDSGGTALRPATAQLSVYGSNSYTYSYDTGKVSVSSSGAVSLASGYTPPLAGETVTITATDYDDSTLYATVDITLSSQCVLAMYKDKASHDAGTSPDYTKFFGGSDGTSSSGSLYALAGSLIETNKGAQTGHTEQISDWQKTTPSSAKLSKTADITVDGDTKIYALYSMAVTIDNGQTTGKDKIAKPSTLLAQLISTGKITTQDSAGTKVMPATAQLTVTGSDGYTFSSSPSGKIDITNAGVVSIAAAANPSIAGETITITATDTNDSTITAQCTVKICSQVVCAIYIDKATCEANGTPGYTKILDNTVDSSTSPSMNVTPYSLIGSTFETQKGKTISAWQYQSSTYAPMVKNGSWLVSGDRKIYAGWQIDGISTTEIVLWRFTDTAADRQATLIRPAGNSYSVEWLDSNGTSISSCPISHSANGTNVDISVTNNANLSALEDSTDPGVYHATYRVSLQSDPASFTDVPVTVKDAMYVNSSGELAFRAGKTLPANLSITSPLNGKTFNSIASNAFKNLTYLTSLTISGIDGRIYGNAFNGCSALQSVTITGSGSLGIDGGAFSNCPNLATINIYNVGSIAMNSFVGTSASSITITSTTMTKINGFSHANCGTITIPGSVTTIGSSAFAGTTFQRVNIPKSVIRFESYAFQQTSGPIYYAGTEAEWNAITKDSGNTISASRLHFNATW